MKENYKEMVKQGKLRQDKQQERVVSHLSSIGNRMVAAKGSGGLTARGTPKKVKGLYLHGSVGTGKSMLMDSFSNELSALLPGQVWRQHFHEFMLHVHKRIHQHKLSLSSQHAIPAVAAEICAVSSLLCLDEFQVTDIADAAILSQLMGALWAGGVTLVATSNRPPEKLYENGLNRHVYLPKFEALLHSHCKVVDISLEAPAHIDYRLGGTPLEDLFVVGSNAPEAMEEVWQRLHSQRKATADEQHVTLDIAYGRTLTAKRRGERAAWFGFQEVCGAALGASDYLCLAADLDVLFLHTVPVFSLNTHNEARRFMNLVDIFYDQGCAVVLGAEGSPAELLRLVDEHEGGQSLGQQPSPVEGQEVVLSVGKGGGSSSGWATTYIGDVEWSSTGRVGVSLAALSSIRDVSFSKARAVSRLEEMRSARYLASRPRCAALLAAVAPRRDP